MRRVTLDTSTDQLDALHQALHHARRSSTVVKVDRTALSNLLLDHSRLVALHQGRVLEAAE